MRFVEMSPPVAGKAVKVLEGADVEVPTGVHKANRVKLDAEVTEPPAE